MAGEYEVAKKCIAQALDVAAQDRGMSPQSMCDALLATLLGHILKSRSRKDLLSFIEFQIEASGEDEFVITRGC